MRTRPVITYEGSDNAPQDLEAAGIDVLVNRAYCLDTATGDLEEIINRNPDVIILLTQGDQTTEGARTALLNRPELRDVTAIRNDDVVVLPFGFVGPSPVAVEGLEVLAERLGVPT